MAHLSFSEMHSEITTPGQLWQENTLLGMVPTTPADRFGRFPPVPSLRLLIFAKTESTTGTLLMSSVFALRTS